MPPKATKLQQHDSYGHCHSWAQLWRLSDSVSVQSHIMCHFFWTKWKVLRLHYQLCQTFPHNSNKEAVIDSALKVFWFSGCALTQTLKCTLQKEKKFAFKTYIFPLKILKSFSIQSSKLKHKTCTCLATETLLTKLLRKIPPWAHTWWLTIINVLLSFNK